MDLEPDHASGSDVRSDLVEPFYSIDEIWFREVYSLSKNPTDIGCSLSVGALGHFKTESQDNVRKSSEWLFCSRNKNLLNYLVCDCWQ